MLTRREVRKCPKDDHALKENLGTQPYKHQKVFAAPNIITEGWHLICPSSKIKKEKAKSFSILRQRLVIFRTKSGQVYAHDAFCPHLGTDLGNGRVINENIQCLFHKWEFDGKGTLVQVPCVSKRPDSEKNKLQTYPVTEKYGYIWVFSAEEKTHELPSPPGMQDEAISSFYLRKIVLKVHHHILMSNAVDLQHFKTLHGLNIKFTYEVVDEKNGIFQWNLKGELTSGAWTLRLFKLLFADSVDYSVLFAGGTVTGLRVKIPKLFRGKGPSFPDINIIWGARPREEGVGEIFNFLVVKNYKGFFGIFKKIWAYTVSFLVLTLLRDDDIFVYPNMRFNVGNLTEEDQSLGRFIQLCNSLAISSWTSDRA